MGTMPDEEIVAKSLEIQKHVERVNELIRELAFEGCRIDIDTVSHQQIGWSREVPVLTVDVYRRISG